MDNSKIITQRELFEALHEQYRKKNAAYGNSAHQTYKAWGDVSYLVRISDKLHRMNQLIETPLTDDIGESILDTIGDCITYMIMLLADSEAADYAVNGRTYEDAVEDTFASFERGYEGMTHWGRIDIDDLCRTWEESNFDNNYHPLREMIADLAFQWLLRARFYETWDTSTTFAEADRLPGNDRGGFGSTGAR